MQNKNQKIKPSDLPHVQALAFLGDAVCSLYVRRMLVLSGISHAGELNRLSLSYVTAKRQSEMLAAIRPLLTEEEQDLCRRAHNAGHLSRPKSASMKDYREATAFEALLGFLEYTGGSERLLQLLSAAVAIDEEVPNPQFYKIQ